MIIYRKKRKKKEEEDNLDYYEIFKQTAIGHHIFLPKKFKFNVPNYSTKKCYLLCATSKVDINR